MIGDLIVAVEGHRIQNFDQYRAANAFSEKDDMKLTVWRGGKLVPIVVTAPNRYMGVELRSYPIEGLHQKAAGSHFSLAGRPDPKAAAWRQAK